MESEEQNEERWRNPKGLWVTIEQTNLWGVPGEGTEKEVEKPSEKIMQVSKLDEANASHIQGAQMNPKHAKSEETYTKTRYKMLKDNDKERILTVHLKLLLCLLTHWNLFVIYFF